VLRFERLSQRKKRRGRERKKQWGEKKKDFTVHFPYMSNAKLLQAAAQDYGEAVSQSTIHDLAFPVLRDQ